MRDIIESVKSRVAAWKIEREEKAKRKAVDREWADARARRRDLEIHAREIPESIKRAWMESGPKEFEGMPVSERAWVIAATALMEFFEAAGRSSKTMALPSLGADSVWHAWLREDPKGLKAFCERRFGRALEHTEKERLGVSLEEGIANCWGACCALEGRGPLKRDLPWVFEADRRMGMPGGWAYEVSREGKLAHRDLSPEGEPAGMPIEHVALTAMFLAGLGWVSHSEAMAHEAARRKAASGSDGSSCGIASVSGSSCGSSASCGDGSGSCSGGSSCGSSCGGGGCGG